MSRKVLFVSLFVLFVTVFGVMMVDAQGPRPGSRAPSANAGMAFTYQGQLKSSGSAVNGTCNFQFGLWDASSGGSQVSGTISQTLSVTVTNGLFTTPINFGASAFNGDARYLGIAVACPSGSLTPMSVRQALTPAPMALALPGLFTQQNATSPNLIGGYSGNIISATVVGGTIGGGGQSGFENKVWANFATIGGGAFNTASGYGAFIGGGGFDGTNYSGNMANGTLAVVAGGAGNVASGYGSVVSGGGGWYAGSVLVTNTASAAWATVGGGTKNTASAAGGTVPGGNGNLAGGENSFAAGTQAHAYHNGAFVWADDNYSDFASTANNQFLIRAGGGVGIGTPSPNASVHISGIDSNLRIQSTATNVWPRTIYQTDVRQWDSGVGGSNVYNDLKSKYYIFDATAAQPRLVIDTSGNVGIGVTAPATELQVNGNIRVGTSGTNGCLQNFSGTVIGGTCSSDAHLKKNVTAFPNVLNRVVQLQPVSYEWRADEFPDYHFSANIRATGVIAQDVERVFPELVSTDDQGFKAVNYSEIPMLLLQALKDLRNEKDAQVSLLQSQVATLQSQNTAQQKEIADLQARLTALEQSRTEPMFGNGWMLGALMVAAVVIGTRRWGGGR